MMVNDGFRLALHLPSIYYRDKHANGRMNFSLIFYEVASHLVLMINTCPVIVLGYPSMI